MVSESVRAYSTIVPSFAQVLRGTLGKAADFCGDSMRGSLSNARTRVSCVGILERYLFPSAEF